jgi:hypothetical protein
MPKHFHTVADLVQLVDRKYSYASIREFAKRGVIPVAGTLGAGIPLFDDSAVAALKARKKRLRVRQA